MDRFDRHEKIKKIFCKRTSYTKADPERYLLVMRLRREGVKLRIIAKILNVTVERVRQMNFQARRKWSRIADKIK